MDEFVPKDHLLRQIDEAVDLGFIKKEVKHLYSVHPETLHLWMVTINCFQFGNCQFRERSRRSRNYAETY